MPATSKDRRLGVIVCTYRRPKAVARLLQVLAHQTYTPAEALIVDASLDPKPSNSLPRGKKYRLT